MNDQENNIDNKLALEKLKTEMEILTNRWEHFRNNTDNIDKKIKNFQISRAYLKFYEEKFFLNGKKNVKKISIADRTSGKKN